MTAVSEGEAAAANESPGGKIPVRDQKYGEVPPFPVSVAEYD
jgi:hypothetical protein